MNPSTAVVLDLALKSTALLAMAAAFNAVWRGRRAENDTGRSSSDRRRGEGRRVHWAASAAHRHLVWSATFCALLLLPFGRLIIPAWPIEWPVDATQSNPTLAPAELHVIRSEMPAAPPVPSLQLPSPSLADEEPRTWTLPDWRFILFLVWLAGVLLILAGRLAGSVQLRKLLRCSARLERGAACEIAAQVAEELGAQRWKLRESAGCSVPMTWGTWDPVVMLPVDVHAWPEPRLRAVLRHEFAHLARRDHLTRWLVQIVAAFYWPHPLVWLAARAVRTAQEQACDDHVLRAGTGAAEYAAQLLQVARAFAGPPLVARYAVGMAQPSTLRTRIKAIVDERLDRRPTGRGATLLAFGIAVTCGGVMALTQLRAQLTPSDGLPALEVASGRQVEMEAKFITVPATVFARALPGAGERTGYLTTMTNAEAAALQERLISFAGPMSPGGTPPALDPKSIDRKLFGPNDFPWMAQGVNLLSAPRVTARDGQRAVIEVIHEHRLPARSGDGFEILNEGVTFEAEPRLRADGVQLWFRTVVTERLPGAKEPFTWESFQQIDYPWPDPAGIRLGAGDCAVIGGWATAVAGQKLLVLIRARAATQMQPAGANAADLDAVILPEVRFTEMPLSAAAAALEQSIREQWGTHKVTTHVENFDGQPVVLGGLVRENGENVHARAVAIVAQTRSGGPEPRVTLALRNVSATRALRELARAAGRHVYFDDSAIHLARPLPASALAAADAIILPRVKLTAVTLHDALAKLEALARAEHPRAGDVRIVQDIPGDAQQTEVTLDLQNASLSTAVARVAELSGFALSASADVLHVHAIDAPPAGTTRVVAPTLTQGMARAASEQDLLAAEEIKLEVKVIDLSLEQLTQEMPGAADLRADLPRAEAVADKPGFVTSPYEPAAGYIDVRGFPPGTEVKDPFSGKMLLLPRSESAVTRVFTEAEAQRVLERLEALPKASVMRPAPVFARSGKQATISLKGTPIVPGIVQEDQISITANSVGNTLDLELLPFTTERRAGDPVFSTRKITTAVSVFPGQTVALAQRGGQPEDRVRLILVTPTIRTR